MVNPSVPTRSGLGKVLLLLAMGCLLIGGSVLAGVAAWSSSQLQLARANLANRQFAQAMEGYKGWMSVWGCRPDVCLETARAARLNRDATEADHFLRRAKELGAAPDRVDLEADLQDVQRGQVGVAPLHLWSMVAQGHPDSGAILEAMAIGYSSIHRWPMAMRCLDPLVAQQPHVADFLALRGKARLQAHMPERALADFRLAVERNPSLTAANKGLADALMEVGQPEEALAPLERVLAANPEDLFAILGLARCRRMVGDRVGALALLEQAMLRMPNDSRVLGEQGLIRRDQGHLAEAEVLCRQSLALDRMQPAVHRALADLVVRRGGSAAEAKKCEEAAELIEADIRALKELANRMLLDPEDLVLPCEYAAILMRNGQEGIARQWIEGVLQVDGRNKLAHRFMAESFQRRGLTERADFHLRQSQ